MAVKNWKGTEVNRNDIGMTRSVPYDSVLLRFPPTSSQYILGHSDSLRYHSGLLRYIRFLKQKPWIILFFSYSYLYLLFYIFYILPAFLRFLHILHRTSHLYIGPRGIFFLSLMMPLIGESLDFRL